MQAVFGAHRSDETLKLVCTDVALLNVSDTDSHTALEKETWFLVPGDCNMIIITIKFMYSQAHFCKFEMA